MAQKPTCKRCNWTLHPDELRFGLCCSCEDILDMAHNTLEPCDHGHDPDECVECEREDERYVAQVNYDYVRAVMG